MATTNAAANAIAGNMPGGLAKKVKLTEGEGTNLGDVPDEATLSALMKNFEQNVTCKVRSIEDQLRDAACRLEARIGELELVVCLAENRVALALDPRHLENMQKWKAKIQEIDEMLSKITPRTE